MLRCSASSRYHRERQFRQKPAKFIRSMFWTSVLSRKCSTRRRNVAASSSVRVLSSIAISSLLCWTLCSAVTTAIEALPALRRRTTANLIHCQIFLVRGDKPAIPEGVFDPADTITVKLIGYRADELCPCGDSALDRSVSVFDIEMDRDWRAANGPWAQRL